MDLLTDISSQLSQFANAELDRRTRDIFRDMVAAQPGSEPLSTHLFGTNDLGRVLSTVRGEDTRKNMRASGILNPPIAKQPKTPTQGHRFVAGDADIFEGDPGIAFSAYQAVADDPKASREIREAAAQLARQAAERLNNAPLLE